MIPVSPRSNAIRVFACCRKLTRWIELSRMTTRAEGCWPEGRRSHALRDHARHRLDRFGVVEILEPELDECIAIDVRWNEPLSQLVANRFGERGTSTGCAVAVDANDLGPARVHVKVKRAALVLAKRFVIELAHDVSWHIAHDQSDDLAIDAA